MVLGSKGEGAALTAVGYTVMGVVLFALSLPIHGQGMGGGFAVIDAESNPFDVDAAAVRQRLDVQPLLTSRDWLRRFYAERAYRPVWFSGNRVREAAKRVALRLATASTEGLDARAYPLPRAVIDDAGAASADAMAQAEIAMTDVVLRYARHLRDGQFEPRRVDAKWDIKKEPMDPPAWLAAALSGDLDAAFDDLPPPHAEYAYLRSALAEHLKLRENGGWPAFPASGPRKFEPGARHAQIALLRERLKATDGPLNETADPEFYDDALVAAVKGFQRRHGLNEDGVVGFGTRAALAAPVEERIAQLAMAMERWRWMPRELGAVHVLVNVPAYRLWLVEEGKVTRTMRTIVGKYDRQTPTFSADISYLVLNPKWYVPNRIAVEDLVPKAQQDPEFYRRGGYTVYDKETGEPVDPLMVDWSAYGKGRPMPFRLVQDAGDSNALGNIKFMFSNPYGVYLHDTSKPSLFRKDRRAFSSGCIRVEAPLDLASVVLSSEQTVPPGEVESMIARAPKNRHLTLQQKIPLHVTYITAWADGAATYFYEDIYKRDKGLLNPALKPR